MNSSDPYEDTNSKIKRLALIDGDFIPFYCTVGNKVLDDAGQPVRQENGNFLYTDKTLEEAILGASKILDYTFTNTQADCYIGVLGVGESFRKKLYPSYKANRIGKPLPKWFREVREWLIEYKKFITIEGLEADDMVNILRNKMIYRSEAPYEPFIVSPDKDILSLEGTHYDPKHGIWVTTSKEDAHYKKFSDLLQGQVGDNIKGIPGVGKVKAAKILSSVEPHDYLTEVLLYYVGYFGEEKGIEEFYKNYKLLTILKDHEIEIPVPVEVE